MNRDEILKRYNLIEDNINRVKEKYNINYDVTLVAVSKYSSIETIKEFLLLNIDLPLGESRAQSLRDRVGEIGKIKDNVKWHFIGRIQSNKVKYIVKYADLIQSVDSIEIAECINKEALKNNKIQNILLQFNISDETQKGGFRADEYIGVYENIIKMSNVSVKGLMAIGKDTEDTNIIEEEFEKLNIIYNEINKKYDNTLSILSMGMSSDYELAIKHGSNMVRIGSSFLGNS
ncbi:YggS family pyridoxal phosphate-dependent enzyme [Brachyspira hampsonii]|uniref:YggS family pyridoxal phosphate-dependent enzyme n=1 Tax=Brachyspira hampsonii TaxID=1287055 RepID=UPI000D3A9AA6|nr:YggS family pyridoxal phosphate-dependent enzyme [Brachyspira hampsonii]PTY40540.1 alanine racemase [Brachyspira hampsonii bv. II]